jgi:GDPmannose 4,6-dehydratase
MLLGDSSKARRVLKWKPKVNFKQLVRMMVDSDMQVVRQTIYGLKGK